MSSLALKRYEDVRSEIVGAALALAYVGEGAETAAFLVGKLRSLAAEYDGAIRALSRERDLALQSLIMVSPSPPTAPASAAEPRRLGLVDAGALPASELEPSRPPASQSLQARVRDVESPPGAAPPCSAPAPNRDGASGSGEWPSGAPGHLPDDPEAA